jgi:hypothetical protein
VSSGARSISGRSETVPRSSLFSVFCQRAALCAGQHPPHVAVLCAAPGPREHALDLLERDRGRNRRPQPVHARVLAAGFQLEFLRQRA